MTVRLNITAPVTITVLAGSGSLSSLDALPPGGITISDPITTDMLSVTLADGTGTLAAGGSVGNTLTLNGTELQLNAALAELTIIEPATSSRDVLTLTATDPSFLPAQTEIGIDVIPVTTPAFVGPATLVTIHPNSLDSLSSLLLSDPIASGLAQMGLGREETLNLTLSVTSGILLLPGFNDSSAISATGIGTGFIDLSFTADDIGAVNQLLSGLQFVGPAINEHLIFALRNLTGVLPTTLTYGKIYLYFNGTAGADGTYTSGSQTVILGGETLAGTMGITGITAVLGGISGAGSVVISPDASLQLPYDSLSLDGTSLDFGTLAATALTESGTLVAGDGASFAGPVLLGTGGLADFTGLLNAGGAAAQTDQIAVSLAAGAVLSGAGTLLAGNFSESGLIEGPGTLLAPSGDTLTVAAGSIGGGAQLEVAPGGVMVLGPVTPLLGVFNDTPVSIDSSVTLSFLANGGAGVVSGGYAGTLGGNGGAFVISGPEDFSGIVEGFTPGDALIFPGLSDFNIITAPDGATMVTGFLNETGQTVTYALNVSLQNGTYIASGQDAAGDATLFMRAQTATITQSAELGASAGIAQPLLGLGLQLPVSTTQSLTLTIAVSDGVLSDGALGPTSSLTLHEPSLAAMNAALAGLTYTGTGVPDSLTFSSGSAPLLGVLGYASIETAQAGTVSGYAGLPLSAGQVVSFGPSAGLPVANMAAAPGALLVTGTADFADALTVNGVSGTALDVDAGATAIFDEAARAALGADATIGDAGGAGTLVIITPDFSSSGNLTITSDPNAPGSAVDVLGALTLAGALDIGAAETGTLDLSGSLATPWVDVGQGGTVFALGSANASLGGVIDSGGVALDGAAQITSTGFDDFGTLVLGGTASLTVTGAFLQGAGTSLQIGQDAGLSAIGVVLQGGAATIAGTAAVSGTMLSSAYLALQGGVIGAAALSLASGTLAGFGDVSAPVIADAGVIIAQGGELVLNGSVADAGTVQVAASAALNLTGGFSGAPVAFTGGSSQIILNDAALGFSGATNLVASDAIDLVGIAPSLVSYSGGLDGTLSASDLLGNSLASFTLGIAAAQPAVTIVSDGEGGSLITVGGELPCFARGTGLLTPHGYRPVESFKPGDPLITASGARRPVRWIGKRTLDLGDQKTRDARPVLIMPGAFGPGLPARPLRLSPLHCVYQDGVLIPVTHLVNGATIKRERATAMTYYHIELDRHDILLAEGLPCESYFDAGNRGALYEETGRRCPARKAFAPTVTSGARLAAVRKRLHGLAIRAGFSLTYWPYLRAIEAGITVEPELRVRGAVRLARFRFIKPVQELVLIAHGAAPADTDPASNDRRELGICLTPRRDWVLGHGFYPRAAGDTGVWMGTSGQLRLPRPAQSLTLKLTAVVQSWRKPVDGPHRPA